MIAAILCVTHDEAKSGISDRCSSHHRRRFTRFKCMETTIIVVECAAAGGGGGE